MAKLTITDDAFDIDKLDEAEVGDDYEEYEGPVAPKNTILAGYLKKIWATTSQAGDLMFVNLFISAGNTGDKAQYNGMALFDRIAFSAKAKFKWQPFISAFGFTLAQIKGKTDVADEDENNGSPVNKIGKFKPGEDAKCRVLVGRSRYEGELRNEVSKWLPADEADEADDDDGDSEPF